MKTNSHPVYSLLVNHPGQALVKMIELFHAEGIKSGSRNGTVQVLPRPVVIHYTNPAQMVLENPVRNCNPFFHLIEAAWMLCGRNDIASLDYFNSHLKSFSDNGTTYHGAYGHRWRRHFQSAQQIETLQDRGIAESGDTDLEYITDTVYTPIDQLEHTINVLKADRTSRRCVISMWDPTVDIPQQSQESCKDIPCNTTIYVQHNPMNEALDIHVMNRSNDVIWGMLGANVVHFSILHQYLAAKIGSAIGSYYHYTANAHVYTDIFSMDTLTRMAVAQEARYMPVCNNPYAGSPYNHMFPYTFSPDQFLATMEAVFRYREQTGSWEFLKDLNLSEDTTEHTHTLFLFLYMPVLKAWRLYKLKKHDEAIKTIDDNVIGYPDWKRSCVLWLQRAKERYTLGNPYATDTNSA